MHKSFKSRIKNYRFTFGYTLALIAIFLSLIGATIYLIINSIERANSTRDEIFSRDMRELVNLFDGDEKFVLEQNIDRLVKLNRKIAPLLLPRQYYVGLPSGRTGYFPKTPPRNCFVDLRLIGNSLSPSIDSNDKFCSYFVPDERSGKSGRFLFFNMVYGDTAVNTLLKGDIRYSADGVRMKITDQGEPKTWWIFLQTPSADVPSNVYEITAFRELADGRRERDSRVEGWAFGKAQVDGTYSISLMGRINFHAIRESYAFKGITETWPPSEWKQISIELERNDVANQLSKIRHLTYLPFGTANISFAKNGQSIFDAQAQLFVQLLTPDGKTGDVIEIMDSKQRFKPSGWLHVLQTGDLLLAHNPTTRSLEILNTNMSIQVRHPGTVIESGMWHSLVALAVLLSLFLLISLTSFFRLVRPIWMISRVANSLINERHHVMGNAPSLETLIVHGEWRRNFDMWLHRFTSEVASRLEDKSIIKATELPYADRDNEIGGLAKAFNELLADVRSQAKETEHRGMLEQRRAEDRQSTLRMIRHEVGNQMTKLANPSPDLTPAKQRKLIERMMFHFDQLDEGTGPEGVEMTREIVDIDKLLAHIVSDLLMSHRDISYVGTSSAVSVRIDIDLFTQSIEHIIQNAVQFRNEVSTIDVKLEVTTDWVLIKIINLGPNIPEDKLEEVFLPLVSLRSLKTKTEDNEGLGLYMARTYILRMYGDIKASNVAGGVMFAINIPKVSA